MNRDPNRPRNAGENTSPEPRADRCDMNAQPSPDARRVQPGEADEREQANAERAEATRPAQVTPAQKRSEAPPPAEMGPPEGPGA